jgi:hypothetical protein
MLLATPFLLLELLGLEDFRALDTGGPVPSADVSLRWVLDAVATGVSVDQGDRTTRVTLLLGSPNPLKLRSITDADTGVLVVPSRAEFSLRRGAQVISTAAFTDSRAAVRSEDVRTPGGDDTLTVTVWPNADQEPTTRVYGVEYQRV